MVSAFFISAGVVALSELGDKTQLFALLLSLRYRASFRILAGIFLATVFNHIAIGCLAVEIAEVLPHFWLRMGTGLISMALGAWMLLPDTLSGRDVQPSRFGPFLAALIGFFILEIGDKTQIATMLMTSVYHPFAAVMTGSIVGMMVMNIPVVILGKDLNARLPLPFIRIGSALLFVGIGGAILPIWN